MRLNQLGARVRLVKGAYNEPKGVAYQDKGDVDAAFLEILKLLLVGGNYPAIATHDPAMIAAARAFASQRDISADRYEFQMLYGIRTARQLELAQAGYQVRIYVPFGEAWYPYFMRRLAERPANLWFFVRSIFRA